MDAKARKSLLAAVNGGPSGVIRMSDGVPGLVEYEKNVLAGLHGYRKELWPFFLASLLLVLAIEMTIANGPPWKKS